MTPPPRSSPSLVVAVPRSALAGCGNKEETTTHGDDRGHLPRRRRRSSTRSRSRATSTRSDVEDRDYLLGVPPGDAAAEADEAWFGVFMRVENTERRRPLPAASDFEISDTQGNVFRPVPIDPQQPVRLPAGRSLRPAGDAARRRLGRRPSSASIQGALLLFKLKPTSLATARSSCAITGPTRPERRSTDRRPRRLAATA